jgi:hypothetical protein
LGYSENRLYAELIYKGLLMHEQMAYMAQLQALRVSATEGLTLLALAPDVEPDPKAPMSTLALVQWSYGTHTL